MPSVPIGVVFIAIAILAALVVFLFRLHFFVRPLVRLFVRVVYRLRVFDSHNVPREGAVLLVCHSSSFVDWMLLSEACPRRIRFVQWTGGRTTPLLQLFQRMTRSILIDVEAGLVAIEKSRAQIGDALNRGELICLFAETWQTPAGDALSFHKLFEQILQRVKSPLPVVPVCINQMWGSLFTYRQGKLERKFPPRLPYPVAVMFGEAVMSPTPGYVTRKIPELSAEMAIRDSDRSRAVHRHFVRIAANLRQMFRPCLIDTSSGKPRTLSFIKALVGIILISRWLKPRLGTEKNVGLWLPSSVGGALANVALAVLGRTSVNLNYTAGIDSVKSAVHQTGLRTVITSRRFLAKLPLDLGEQVTLILLEDAAGAIGKLQRIRAFLTVLLLPGWVIDRWILRMGHQSLDDIATIIFSSGSTGDPKGVMLSHRNIACNVESMVAHLDVDHRERVLGVLPFFHSFGYTVTLWVPLVIGGSAVYYADPRQAKDVGDLCRVHQCTVLASTATFLRFYLRRCEPDDFRSLRILVCGAEKLPPSLALEFGQKFGILPTEGYGCTELSPVVSANTSDQLFHGITQINNRIGSIGRPIPGVAARILDAETLQPLSPGLDGLIFIKGANVMVGYLGKPEMTDNVIVDGWYNTGDVGHIDEDGFIIITGRLSRFAKIGGEMVPLEKIEDDLHAILETSDRILAVASIPDEKKGERIIVLHLDSMIMPVAELTTKLSERGIPNLCIPSDRDFHPIAELPVLGTGKLDLRRVKELALERAKR